MKPEPAQFSFEERAAKKAAARDADEAALQSGGVSHGKLARINGGGIRGVRHIGPSARIRRLAAS